MLKKFKADLHIHTCLSPCADEEMFPQRIIKQAKMNNLDIVGICDHNSAENVIATQKIGQREKIAVIGVIEATSLSLQEIVQTICSLEGLTIASHIDRNSFSIIAQLGFIPEGLLLDALELSSNYESQTSSFGGRQVNPEIYGFPLVTFSDAHFLKDIGKSYTIFLMEEASIGEIKKALSGEDGRKVMI